MILSFARSADRLWIGVITITDRDRLICLLSEYDFDATFCNICERPFDDCAVCGSERLADYLIEHGVIVLPCKVGDTLYCESAIKGHITYLVAPDDEWISKIGKFSEKKYSSPVKKRKKS